MDNFNLIHEFALVCGIIITLLILLLLGKKQNKQLHDYFLLIFFIAVLFLFLNHYANYHQIFWLHVSTNFLTASINFLIGPLIYYYIKSLFTKVNYKTPRFWLTFLPFLIYTLIFTLPLTLSNPTDGLIVDYLHLYLDNSTAFYTVETLYLLFFTLLALQLLEQFTNVLKSYYSNLTRADILWSKRLLLGVILYLVIDITLTISEITLYQFLIPHYYINVMTILLVVLYLGYYGFFQAQMLLPSFLMEKTSGFKSKNVKKKSTKSNTSFSTEEITQIKAALHKSLEKEQLYLNETLTLSDLAQEVQLTDKKLSAFINQELDTNFYELVNQYRIATFKTEVALVANQNLTIWGIASQCGFNSKTSFNRIFKKQTGLTPSQYQKTLGGKKPK